MINVTKTFLPEFDAYVGLIKRAWDAGWITNNGEMVQELEARLKEYLGVKHLLFCTNGTVVLQMALKALNITGEVITTPFSYVATTNTILWENCTPVFADVEPATLCIDPEKIETLITERTQAILATHVYGYPCAVERLSEIAEKHNIRVIYDGAHAFGALLHGKSLLSYGDIATCSFHATKVFHTVEGGCIICHDDELARKLMLYRQFGHVYDDYFDMGINGKNSEFHAAMGLANLPHLSAILQTRKDACVYYRTHLSGRVSFLPDAIPGYTSNSAYFPVFFPTEAELLHVKNALLEHGIATRRYFFPSLNELPYQQYQPCPVSEDVSRRVLCLPLHAHMDAATLQRICTVINSL